MSMTEMQMQITKTRDIMIITGKLTVMKRMIVITII